jgi:HSP20 family molecular chaperone IbpA
MAFFLRDYFPLETFIDELTANSERRIADYRAARSVSYDVVNDGDTTRISIVAPGANKNDFSVHKDGNKVVAACHNNEVKFFKPFTRSWVLPDGLTDEDVNASYTNGMLEIVVNKARLKEEPNKKAIAIQ